MSEQSDNRRNFEAWFSSQVKTLIRDRDAGFVIVMVTFPLLERYLRQKSLSNPKTNKFKDALLGILPELGNRANAELFWRNYRNNLLHKVALSEESHGLSQDKPILEVCANGKVWLNPHLFAERVLATIRNDFDTFEKGVALPQVFPLHEQPTTSSAYSIYLGTGMPPVEI